MYREIYRHQLRSRNVAIPFGQPESHSRYPTTTRIRSIPNTLNVPLRHRTLTRPDYVAGGKR